MPGFLSAHRRLVGLGLAVLACLLLSNAAQAQWKWRDSRGQIHISDIPPPRDVPDKDVLQRPEPTARRSAPPPAAAPAAPTTAASAPARPMVDPELEQRRLRAEQEQAARANAEKKRVEEQRKDNCLRAREQLATMESGVRVMRVRPDGEREYLTDAQRAAEAQRARGLIASDCR